MLIHARLNIVALFNIVHFLHLHLPIQTEKVSTSRSLSATDATNIRKLNIVKMIKDDPHGMFNTGSLMSQRSAFDSAVSTYNYFSLPFYTRSKCYLFFHIHIYYILIICFQVFSSQPHPTPYMVKEMRSLTSLKPPVDSYIHVAPRTIGDKIRLFKEAEKLSPELQTLSLFSTFSAELERQKEPFLNVNNESNSKSKHVNRIRSATSAITRDATFGLYGRTDMHRLPQSEAQVF